MSSENIDRARELIDRANESRSEGAIGFLVLALEALCDELEAHQHRYVGPTGLGGRWYITDRSVTPIPLPMSST